MKYDWNFKSNADDMYCAVHNAECDLLDKDSDPIVLILGINRIPSSWMCPQAVQELCGFEHQADAYAEENNTENPQL